MTKSHFCPKCNSNYFYDTEKTEVMNFTKGSYTEAYIAYSVCPSCKETNLTLVAKPVNWSSYVLLFKTVEGESNTYDEAPKEVPINIANDYNESATVLSYSPKASAALSRRCLQNILNERGYKARDLRTQIEAVLNEKDVSKAVPETLRMALDAIRNFGNFSAHPIADQNSLEIIDVEEGEAEWCLEILQEAFECFYVRPKRIEERKEALNQKLKSAGKPEAQ